MMAQEEQEEELFEVEHIVDTRKKDGVRYYKVRWKGYNAEEDTWEPEENVFECRDVLEEFWKKKKQRERKRQQKRKLQAEQEEIARKKRQEDGVVSSGSGDGTESLMSELSFGFFHDISVDPVGMTRQASKELALASLRKDGKALTTIMKESRRESQSSIAEGDSAMETVEVSDFCSQINEEVLDDTLDVSSQSSASSMSSPVIKPKSKKRVEIISLLSDTDEDEFAKKWDQKFNQAGKLSAANSFTKVNQKQSSYLAEPAKKSMISKSTLSSSKTKKPLTSSIGITKKGTHKLKSPATTAVSLKTETSASFVEGKRDVKEHKRSGDGLKEKLGYNNDNRTSSKIGSNTTTTNVKLRFKKKAKLQAEKPIEDKQQVERDIPGNQESKTTEFENRYIQNLKEKMTAFRIAEEEECEFEEPDLPVSLKPSNLLILEEVSLQIRELKEIMSKLPESRKSSFGDDDLWDETIPDEPVTIPDKPVIIPDKPVIIPEKTVIIPDKLVIIPDKPVIVPDKPVIIPEKHTNVAQENDTWKRVLSDAEATAERAVKSLGLKMIEDKLVYEDITISKDNNDNIEISLKHFPVASEQPETQNKKGKNGVEERKVESLKKPLENKEHMSEETKVDDSEKVERQASEVSSSLGQENKKSGIISGMKSSSVIKTFRAIAAKGLGRFSLLKTNSSSTNGDNSPPRSAVSQRVESLGNGGDSSDGRNKEEDREGSTAVTAVKSDKVDRTADGKGQSVDLCPLTSEGGITKEKGRNATPGEKNDFIASTGQEISESTSTREQGYVKANEKQMTVPTVVPLTDTNVNSEKTKDITSEAVLADPERILSALRADPEQKTDVGGVEESTTDSASGERGPLKAKNENVGKKKGDSTETVKQKKDSKAVAMGSKKTVQKSKKVNNSNKDITDGKRVETQGEKRGICEGSKKAAKKKKKTNSKDTSIIEINSSPEVAKQKTSNADSEMLSNNLGTMEEQQKAIKPVKRVRKASDGNSSAKKRSKSVSDSNCNDLVGSIIQESGVEVKSTTSEIKKQNKKSNGDKDIADSSPMNSEDAPLAGILDFAFDLDDYPVDQLVYDVKTSALQDVPSPEVEPRDVSIVSLKQAIRDGDESTVRAALAAGHDIEMVDGASGMTMLQWAAAAGTTNIVELLLRRRAKVDALQKNGMTALMHAAEQGFPETVDILLRCGADINGQQNAGETALMKACKKGHTEVICVLLKHGVDTKLRLDSGLTAQQYAVRSPYYELPSILVEHETRLTRVVESAIATCVGSTVSVCVPPVMAYRCIAPQEGADHKLQFNFKPDRVNQDSDIILFCIRATFRDEKVSMTFGDDNGVRSVALNDTTLLPLLHGVRSAYSLSPASGSNELTVHTHQSNARLIVCVYSLKNKT